jgi:transposase-like protein
MVAAVRRGASIRQVARRFGVAHSTVLHWVARAVDQRLDRVDLDSRRLGPRRPANKVSPEVEQLVLTLRRELKDSSPLGEFGAVAIREEMVRRGAAEVPSVRTIGRILERRGALDGRKRVRRRPPPRGWYLPEVAAQRAELDSFDIIEGLVIQGGYSVEVLNGISLWGGLPESWPRAKITAKTIVSAILGHWRHCGLPSYAQFDNDTVFQGAHHHRDSLGRVARMCLALDVVPVFTPPRETGFQAMVENFNGRWQAKVWARFTFESRKHLLSQSAKFITASRRRAAARIENAPSRYEFPEDWELDLQAELHGKVIFLRRTDDCGRARLLGRTFSVDRHWPHRLVRVEVDLDEDVIRFHALRRREPDWQPLLQTVEYHFPRKRFHD